MKFFLSEKFYQPLIYVVLGLIIYNIFSKVITKVWNESKKRKKIVSKRNDTIISLVKNIIKYLLTAFIILSILGVYGIDTSKIIASLGIAAAVIGLAFQDIIKDFLAGILIIFDDKYSIGDIIEINGFKGEVISLGLMNTKIKSYTGEVKVISNSSFTEVINYSNNNTMLVIDVPVSYQTDLDVLEKLLKDLQKDILKIDNVVNYELLGLNELASSSIIYQIAIECKPCTHIGVKRKVLVLIKKTLDNNNIEIPYNKLDVNIKKEV